MTNTPAPHDPEATIAEGTSTPEHHHAHTGHPDPITGEPDAHPVGVGVGAIAAGAAGAAVGAFAGPVGIVIGAAIGAIAGGLAGKDAAEAPEVSPTTDETSSLDEFDRPNTANTEEPLPASIAQRVTPADDDFFTGGPVSGRDPDAAPLDDFDRPHGAVAATTATAVPATIDATPKRPSNLLDKYGREDDENPLPTASAGLVTPEESSIFADSSVTGDRTTGESGFLTDSPFAASRAVDPGDHFADTPVTAKEEKNREVSSVASDAQAAPAEPASFTEQSILPSSSVDSEEAIRTAAYYRYLDRQAKGQSGSHADDWAEAQKESQNR